MPSSSGASAFGAATFVFTSDNDTIIQQPAEDSIPNVWPTGVTPTRFSDLMPLPHRERSAAKKPPPYELTSEETMQFVARKVEAKNKKISKRCKKRLQ